jgi:hypothetical protein
VPHRRFTGACDQLEVTAGRTRSNPRRRARHCKFEPSRVQPNSPVIPSHRYNGVTAARAGGAGEGRAHSGRGTGSNLGARQLFLPTQEELRVDPVLALGVILLIVEPSVELTPPRTRGLPGVCQALSEAEGHEWVVGTPTQQLARPEPNPGRPVLSFQAAKLGNVSASLVPSAQASATTAPMATPRRNSRLSATKRCHDRRSSGDGPATSGSFIHHPKRSDHRSRIASSASVRRTRKPKPRSPETKSPSASNRSSLVVGSAEP